MPTICQALWWAGTGHTDKVHAVPVLVKCAVHGVEIFLTWWKSSYSTQLGIWVFMASENKEGKNPWGFSAFKMYRKGRSRKANERQKLRIGGEVGITGERVLKDWRKEKILKARRAWQVRSWEIRKGEIWQEHLGLRESTCDLNAFLGLG